MKTTLLSFALLITLSTLAQDIPHFTVTLEGWHEDGRQVPTLFDTIYLETKPKQTLRSFQQIAATPFSNCLLLQRASIGCGLQHLNIV